MAKTFRWNIWIFLIGLQALSAGGCSEQPSVEPAQEFRIGLIVPESSPLQLNARSAIQGARLAVEQANENGGLMLPGGPVPVKLFIEDDKNDPDTAVEAAQRLIKEKNVSVIIGPTTSRSALRVARVAEEMRVPMISPNATHPQLTSGMRYVFRVCFTDSVQGKVLARLAGETLQAQSAGVLFNSSNDYNRCISYVFAKSFETNGGRIVSRKSYSDTKNTDYTDILNSIKYNAPDILVLPNFPDEVKAQVNQARALSFNAVFLGSDSWNPWTLAEDEAFDGTYLTQHWHPQLATEETYQFVEAYQTAYDELPSNIAALTYDAAGVVFYAVRRQEKTDPVAVRAGLMTTTAFPGITGQITYRDSGDPVHKPVVILHLNKGRVDILAVLDDNETR